MFDSTQFGILISELTSETLHARDRIYRDAMNAIIIHVKTIKLLKTEKVI